MSVPAHLVRSALLVVVIVIVNFLLPRLLPGSPLSASGEGSVAFLPAAAQAEIYRSYGLDRPVTVQFQGYVVGLARGDLGRSLATHRPVTNMIGERVPWTIFLVGVAVLAAAVLGGALGTAAAWHPQGSVARVLGPFVVGAGALPEFLVAMTLIVVLGAGLQWFPAGGATTPFLTAGPFLAARDILWHAALPALTLITGLLPAFFLLSRSLLTAALGEPFLLTLRGKGLGPTGILRHLWRNALPAMLTLFGLRLAFAVTGAALVERIFAYPGMGMLLFESVVRRDYPVLQGLFLTSSLVFIGVSLTLDLAACALDPRLRRSPG